MRTIMALLAAAVCLTSNVALRADDDADREPGRRRHHARRGDGERAHARRGDGDEGREKQARRRGEVRPERRKRDDDRGARRKATDRRAHGRQASPFGAFGWRRGPQAGGWARRGPGGGVPFGRGQFGFGMRRGPQGGGAPFDGAAMRKRFLDSLDKNDDGQIDAEEYRAATESDRPRRDRPRRGRDDDDGERPAEPAGEESAAPDA